MPCKMGLCSHCQRHISLPMKGMCNRCLNALGILPHRKKPPRPRDPRSEHGHRDYGYQFIAPWVEYLRAWNRTVRRTRAWYEAQRGITPTTLEDTTP